jgi:formylglycine-generating enzyme required for sulfatase activity
MDFDPYHRWLAILPKDQPPSHYRLLAIDPSEFDPEVIRDAAEARMAHVRTYQLKYSDLSQKILNELGEAKACLLDPKARAAYDRQFSAQGGKSGAGGRVPPPIPPPSSLDRQQEETAEPMVALGVSPPEPPPPPPGIDSGFGHFIADIGSDHPFASPRNRKPLPASRRRAHPWLVVFFGVSVCCVILGIDLSIRSPGTVKTGSGDAPPLAAAPFDARDARRHQEAWAKHLGVPVEMTNSLGMKFVLIPPGEFDMGTSDSDLAQLHKDGEALLGTVEGFRISRECLDQFACETPQHRVAITRPFYLGVCEVTRKQYAAIMGSVPYHWYVVPSEDAAVLASHSDARAFCAILSGRPEERSRELIYSLPTEAEWEHACRAGTTTRYSFGDSEKEVKEYACCYTYGVADEYVKLQIVGQREPNPWQLYDMHGNAWEWCADWFDPNYYKTSPRNDPPGPFTGQAHAARGGCFGDVPLNVRSAWRASFPADYHQGFRVRCSIPVRTAPAPWSLSPRRPAGDGPGDSG